MLRDDPSAPLPHDPRVPDAHDAHDRHAHAHAAGAPHDAYERWVQGGQLPGVQLAPGARVRLLEGDEAGMTGTVVSLQSFAPEPLYVVALDVGDSDVAALQSALHPES